MSSESIAIRRPLELLTEIANTLAQDADAHTAVWLCEGPDDKEAIEYHEPSVAAFVAGNRQAVIDCAIALVTAGQRDSARWQRTKDYAWFLVDRDYHGAEGLPHRVQATTYCSLEADLVAAAGSSTIRGLLLGLDEVQAMELMTAAIAIADGLGCLRLEAHGSSLSLRMSRFPVARVVRDSKLDWNAVEQVLRERHPGEDGIVTGAMLRARRSPRDKQQLALANGHDLVTSIQVMVNSHPSCRGAVSTREVFRTLVTHADPALLDWLAAAGCAEDGLLPGS